MLHVGKDEGLFLWRVKPFHDSLVTSKVTHAEHRERERERETEISGRQKIDVCAQHRASMGWILKHLGSQIDSGSCIKNLTV
jgi:hypothetical protein